MGPRQSGPSSGLIAIRWSSQPHLPLEADMTRLTSRLLFLSLLVAAMFLPIPAQADPPCGCNAIGGGWWCCSNCDWGCNPQYCNMSCAACCPPGI